MVRAHVSNEMLSAYADGSLSDGMSLLVASHLTFCPTCRDKVARLEALGGALMALEDPAEPDPACLSRVMARLDAPEPADEPEGRALPETDVPMPSPVLERLRAEREAIRWRFLLPGLSDHRLEGFDDGEQVTLLRGRPGVRILPHTHCGDEATLVISGRLRDGDTEYAPGDVSLADHTHDHRPEIVGTETCVCLVVLSGRLRFTGPIGRALNLLSG